MRQNKFINSKSQPRLAKCKHFLHVAGHDFNLTLHGFPRNIETGNKDNVVFYKIVFFTVFTLKISIHFITSLMTLTE